MSVPKKHFAITDANMFAAKSLMSTDLFVLIASSIYSKWILIYVSMIGTISLMKSKWKIDDIIRRRLFPFISFSKNDASSVEEKKKNFWNEWIFGKFVEITVEFLEYIKINRHYGQITKNITYNKVIFWHLLLELDEATVVILLNSCDIILHELERDKFNFISEGRCMLGKFLYIFLGEK